MASPPCRTAERAIVGAERCAVDDLVGKVVGIDRVGRHNDADDASRAYELRGIREVTHVRPVVVIRVDTDERVEERMRERQPYALRPRSGRRGRRRPASSIRARLRLGSIHKSAAHTSTPNSRARKIDEIAVPQPRSRTRMPGSSAMTWVNASVSHNTFGPMRFRCTHVASYADARG